MCLKNPKKTEYFISLCCLYTLKAQWCISLELTKGLDRNSIAYRQKGKIKMKTDQPPFGPPTEKKKQDNNNSRPTRNTEMPKGGARQKNFLSTEEKKGKGEDCESLLSIWMFSLVSAVLKAACERCSCLEHFLKRVLFSILRVRFVFLAAVLLSKQPSAYVRRVEEQSMLQEMHGCNP